MHTTAYERAAVPTATVDRALADSRHSIFWLDDVSAPAGERLTRNLEVDLLVVGGGYTGLWTALQAKQRDPDRSVAVVEGGTVGWAASGRNGGFCEASLTHGYDNGQNRWPDEMGVLEELGRQNMLGIVNTVTDNGLDVDLERTGLLKLAVEEHQVPWLSQRPRDAEHVYFDRDAARRELASPLVQAAYWDKNECMLVHPYKLALELARLVRELDVPVFEHTVVRDLQVEGDRVRARTDDAVVTARQVALGTNVFPSLLKRNALMTVPVYDYVLATEPLSTEQLESIGWRNRQGLSDLANQFHYFRLTRDNRIVYGGYDAVYHPGRRMRREYENRPESWRKLASHLLGTFPQLEDVKITHTWAGVVDTSTRFCAYFGTAAGGKIGYAQGFTGLGVAATRFAANVVLDQLGGEKTQRTELAMVRERPLPFPPEPLASIGINATRWSLDRSDHNGGRRNLILRTLDAAGLGFDS